MRKLPVPCVLLSLAAPLLAQKDITVSQPKESKTETVTVNVTPKDKPAETITAEPFINKTTTGPEKATLIAAAIEANDTKDRVTATASGSVVTVKAKDGKVGPVSVTNNSREPINKVTDTPPPPKPKKTQKMVMSCVPTLDSFSCIDGSGEPSVLRVGTARGVAEVYFEAVSSIEEAMLEAAQQLSDLGLNVSMPNTTTLTLLVHPTLDDYALFGCTEPGVLQTATVGDADQEESDESDGAG